jgi:hypothetical protein
MHRVEKYSRDMLGWCWSTRRTHAAVSGPFLDLALPGETRLDGVETPLVSSVARAPDAEQEPRTESDMARRSVIASGSPRLRTRRPPQ